MRITCGALGHWIVRKGAWIGILPNSTILEINDSLRIGYRHKANDQARIVWRHMLIDQKLSSSISM